MNTDEITMDRSVLQQALDALAAAVSVAGLAYAPPQKRQMVDKAITILSAALAAPKRAQDVVDERLVYASPVFTTAIDALNKVKAWRDCDGNHGFPHSLREQIEVVLMAYEARAAQKGQP